MSKTIFIICAVLMWGTPGVSQERGEVGAYNHKFIWTGTQQAFVPNYIMLDVLGTDLSTITEAKMQAFIDEFIHGHGFTGVHVPVYGQWFHIGDATVSLNDGTSDPRTFDVLSMIIQNVYDAGGCTHLWMWGDDSRNQTANSTKGGIMGEQEKRVLDEIAKRLGPLPGWTMGYGFDLWEWVNEEQLKAWHDYLWSKPDWNHLLGARASKNEFDQIYERLDYSSYEYHKPWYDDLRNMIKRRPNQPSFSEDRYRIRHPSKYPEKDYNAEETRRGLWHHTMAGGVAAIWGHLDGDGIYPNKAALKCFSIFWNDKERFRKDMRVDNRITGGYALRDANRYYVFYKENCQTVQYTLEGLPKQAVAVDTRKAYREIDLGRKRAGAHTFEAPYESDWAIAVE